MFLSTGSPTNIDGFVSRLNDFGKLKFVRTFRCFLILFGLLLSSCIGVKDISKYGEPQFRIDELEEKTTIGNEKAIGVGIVPPFFANVCNPNNSIGIFGNYSAFNSGNAYVNLCYHPDGFGLINENIPSDKIAPVSSELRYSFPLLKSSKVKHMFMEFHRSNNTIMFYNTNVCFKRSLNLRIGNHSYMNQFEGSDVEPGSSEFSYLYFLDKVNTVAGGLSYVMFVDHQSRIKVTDKEYKNTTHVLLECFFDVHYAYAHQLDQLQQPNEFGQQYDIPSHLDRFQLNKLGFHTGVKYTYNLEKGFMSLYVGYRRLPGAIYVGDGVNVTSTFKRYAANDFVFGFQFGLFRYIKTKGRIF